METIRTPRQPLHCPRKGTSCFDGEPEEAIAKYLGDAVQMKLHYTYEADANDRRTTGKCSLQALISKTAIR